MRIFYSYYLWPISLMGSLNFMYVINALYLFLKLKTERVCQVSLNLPLWFIGWFSWVTYLNKNMFRWNWIRKTFYCELWVLYDFYFKFFFHSFFLLKGQFSKYSYFHIYHYNVSYQKVTKKNKFKEK